MLRKTLPAILLTTYLVSCTPLKVNYIPPTYPKTKKPIAKIYIDAYADEEYQRPRVGCQKWKPCIENILDKAEKDINPQLKTSKRFQKYFSDIDIEVKKIGTWESPNFPNNLLAYFTFGFMNNFMRIKPIKNKEVDIRIGFTTQSIPALGFVNDIPGKYIITTGQDCLKDNIDTCYKNEIDTLKHELGHTLGLHHNDVEYNQMAHQDVWPIKSRFTNQARSLIADTLLSIRNSRTLDKRIEKNKEVLKATSKFLDDNFNFKLKFEFEQNSKCYIEKHDYIKDEVNLAINASGSLSVEFHYKKGNKKDALHNKKRMHNFYNFLKRLGISEVNEDLIFYKTHWKTSANSHWYDQVINIDQEKFNQHFDKIIDYLNINALISTKKTKKLKEIKLASYATGINIHDFLYYLSKTK